MIKFSNEFLHVDVQILVSQGKKLHVFEMIKFSNEFLHVDVQILVSQGKKLHVFFIFDHWFVLVPSVIFPSV
jgi:hypothetical protein